MDKKIQEAFKTVKEFLRIYDDYDNPTNEFYQKEELKIIKKALKELNDLRKKVKLLDNLKVFKKFVCMGVITAHEENHTYLELRLTRELVEWCKNEMYKKAVENCGKD